MGEKPFPGVFQLIQIGPNIAVFGDGLFKLPTYELSDTFNAIGSSPLMRVIFPNVPDASAAFGQIWEKSLGKAGAFEELFGKHFLQSKTNLLTYGQDTLPGGIGTSLVGGSRGRG